MSGPWSNDQARWLAVTSPRPPARSASIGFTREGAITRSPTATGDATTRNHGSFVGFEPVERHSSFPLPGSWAVTTSPPVTTISTLPPTRTNVGVVYASGDSWMAGVGRSTFQRFFPVAASTATTYDGASVSIPCSTGTYNAPSSSSGDDA